MREVLFSTMLIDLAHSYGNSSPFYEMLFILRLLLCTVFSFKYSID